MTVALQVQQLAVSYGDARALSGVTFDVAEGRALAVLGANGAGKSSLAAAIAGVVKPAAGSIRLRGTEIGGSPPHRIARLGVAYVPEGRGIFPNLSVTENLRAMLRYAVPRSERAAAVDRAIALFPLLGERRRQPAGTLSGGEQQMLALARVLAAPPSILIADEMSLGLAPKLVDLVFDSLARAKEEGVTVVLVEQYVKRALEYADDAVVLRQGEVAWSGRASEAHSEALASYLGAKGLESQ
ncbi:MAG: transporter related protein [Actinomycetia bacterium]|nr:transporter related protein [Actinomycetes bacterium]